MREFSKISPNLWRSPRFRGLATDDAKLFCVYCLTCGHQTSAGCFRAPDAYVASDLAWSEARVAAARDEAIEAGLLAYDADTSEFYVERWFLHNAPANIKHSMACASIIERIDSDGLREKVEAEFAETKWGGKYLDGERPTNEVPRGNKLAETNYLNGRR